VLLYDFPLVIRYVLVNLRVIVEVLRFG